MGTKKTFGILLASAAVFALWGASAPAGAGVNVNVNIGPPPIVVAEPPQVVLVPRSRVYFVPDPQIDVFFYGGYWWSPRGDRWYRSRAYNGPWGVVERRRVPREVIVVPRDYRSRYEHERHIPYGQWKKEHREWEKAERKERKHEQKERKREEKERRRDDREDRGNGRGHGGDHR